MKVSIELLHHCRCAHCELWWTIADIPLVKNESKACPHCFVVQPITEIVNGKGEAVEGVEWVKKSEDIG